MTSFLPFGDSAVLVNFEQRIDPEINAQVIALTTIISQSEIHGVVNCIPAYCSLTISYDPALINYKDLVNKLKGCIQGDSKPELTEPRSLKIPVCYEDEFGLDFDELEDQIGLKKNEIIDLHCSSSFRVYMLGFLPGFVYMGILPKELQCGRKKNPRLSVPSRSVGLAGLQTGIYPSNAPGGWQIIGKTPLKIFDGQKKDPFLFRPGDVVSFKAISTKEFQDSEEQLELGHYDFDQIYG